MELELDEIEALAIAPSREQLEAAAAELAEAELAHEGHIKALEAALKHHEAELAKVRDRHAEAVRAHEAVLLKVAERRGEKASVARVDGTRLVLDEPA